MKTLRLIGMAIIAVIMSVNFTACDDEEEDSNTIDTSSLEGTWGLVRSAGWEFCTNNIDGEKDTWDYTYDPYNPDADKEKLVIKKLTDNTYSIILYDYWKDSSSWLVENSQTGTLNGNTIVYKEQDGQYDYAIIETLTADKLVLHNKYNILVNPDLPNDANHYHNGDYTETYTRMKE